MTERKSSKPGLT